MKLIKIKYFIPVIIITTLLSGCGLFTAQYDALRHQNFTNLKAFHVKFIQDYTAGSGKVWKEESVKAVCDNGELKFSEAYEYALSKDNKDLTGSKAVKYLKAEFTDNCKLSLKRKKLFSKAFVEGDDGILAEIKKQYGYAISGEESRVGK